MIPPTLKPFHREERAWWDTEKDGARIQGDERGRHNNTSIINYQV